MSLRILVVDDNPDDAELTARSLRRWLVDSQVETECGSVAAQQRLRGGAAFDMVLLDWHLGGEDGGAILQSWAADGEEIPPVFFITGAYMTQSQRVRGRAAGARGFLSKPLHPLDLPTLQQV